MNVCLDSPKSQLPVLLWIKPMGMFQPAVLPTAVWHDFLPCRLFHVMAPSDFFTTATAKYDAFGRKREENEGLTQGPHCAPLPEYQLHLGEGSYAQRSRNILSLWRTGHTATGKQFADVMHLFPPCSWEIITPDISPPQNWHSGMQEGCGKMHTMCASQFHILFIKGQNLPSSRYFYKKQFPSATAQSLFLCLQPWQCHSEAVRAQRAPATLHKSLLLPYALPWYLLADPEFPFKH